MLQRPKFLPCDLRGWAALDGTGECDRHALPDSVCPERDWKVWHLLTQALQVLHVGRCLLFCLEHRYGNIWTMMHLYDHLFNPYIDRQTTPTQSKWQFLVISEPLVSFFFVYELKFKGHTTAQDSGRFPETWRIKAKAN